MSIRAIVRGAVLGAFLSVSFVGTSQASDIVDTAAGSPDFSTLVAAVQAADLVSTLKSAGPFTVFAPTNAAFGKFPSGTVEKLLDPANKDLLVKLLTYHVISGSVLAADVILLDSATTVEGSKVKIIANPGGVKIDNAKVVTTDIVVDNGVIHVIDTVLTPKGFLGELNRR